MTSATESACGAAAERRAAGDRRSGRDGLACGSALGFESVSLVLVLVGAVTLIVILSAIVARRVARTRGLFEEGREVEASVQKVKYFRGGSKVTFEFELNGIPYRVSSVFQRWLRSPRFDEGSRIPVLVDPTNPKRAVPRALYEDPDPARSSDRPTPAEQRGKSLLPEAAAHSAAVTRLVGMSRDETRLAWQWICGWRPVCERVPICSVQRGERRAAALSA